MGLKRKHQQSADPLCATQRAERTSFSFLFLFKHEEISRSTRLREGQMYTSPENQERKRCDLQQGVKRWERRRNSQCIMGSPPAG